MKFKELVAIYETTVYHVYSNSDLNEGRGSTILIGTFRSSELAKTFAKGKGVFGSDAEVSPTQAEVYAPTKEGVLFNPESLERFDWTVILKKVSLPAPVTIRTLEAERQEALAKLTLRERELLGF